MLPALVNERSAVVRIRLEASLHGRVCDLLTKSWRQPPEPELRVLEQP